jgi:pilus assembly protein CpaF
VSLAARADRTTSNVTPIRSTVIDDDEIRLPSRDDVRSIVERVRERLSEVPDRATMSDDRLRVLVESQVATVMSLPDVASTIAEPVRVRTAVLDELLGFGPLQDLLDDPKISEIMVNGLDGVFVESKGVVRRTNRSFDTEEQLLRIIDRMVRTSGRRVDQSSPMVDARLPDGSRLNVVLPPLAVDGPSITIRKFTAGHLTTTDLVEQGSLSAEAAEFLQAAVASKANVLVSGGTGTGKTTILNILSSYIGRHERVVTVEDAVELSLNLPNLIRLETRPANAEGAGGIAIRDLVRNSLRMRPDRIVVGEVRGAEALDMLQAMNTGHEGSLSTLHANSPRDALRRLETMVLLGGVELPLRAIREQIASAIDVIVQLTRDAAGRRFVSSITEVVGMEGDVVSTADLFVRSTPSQDSPLVTTGVSSHRFMGVHS